MIETWYAILALMLIVYVVLDIRNFGAGILHLIVSRTPAERRQVFAAVGPVYAWHEVWLVGFGGVMVAVFPRLYAVSFSSYYLALFLILWCFVLRGISIEVRGHFNDRMWQAFWDFVFTFANVLLAILFGAALGNVIRGVPLDASGEFAMAFFTDFGVRGEVGLLDWYTISVSLFCLLVVTAHGATFLALKTDGPVHDRCTAIAQRIWTILPALFVVISIETWVVRPALLPQMAGNPVAWLGIAVVLVGIALLFTGLRQGLESRAFAGSCLLIASVMATGAATIFPVFLYSTLGPENSLTAYQAATSPTGLKLALIWGPFALALSGVYTWFIVRYYSGKVKVRPEA
ncbi:MAG TPA: cytochrome d ubiquinol oxidase subunit II [Candidatus Methylacidiphilales bacterium]